MESKIKYKYSVGLIPSKGLLYSALVIIALGVLIGCQKQKSSEYPITGISPKNIELKDKFWKPRLDTFRARTLPHVLNQCIETGRIKNFAIAAGKKSGDQNGIYPFDDSDVFKLIEGISWWLSYHQDPEINYTLDTLIMVIAAAQESDGYLYTARRNNPDWLESRSGRDRWSNLAWSHELYNSGHLFLAAAAHYEATGKHSLLDVAYRNADLLVSVFGPTGRDAPPGHQVIEMGLVALYRLSHKQVYLDLAKFFLDRRGQHKNRNSLGTYAQDHLPVLQQSEAVGHAVRAAYMYAGMMDVAAFSGDRRYADASLLCWQNVVGKKIYLTGGLGAVGFGERFSDNYDLPNFSAYQETCASIANIMWNQRLFFYTGNGKYLDLLERTLYNVLLAGISQTGDRFFYPNPLASRGYHERHPWFPCACCPTNVSRFIPTIPGLFYAFRNDTIYINLFASSRTGIPVGADTVWLEQHTDYPWSGKIGIQVEVVDPLDLEIRIRIPGWARDNVLPSDLYRFIGTNNRPIDFKLNGKPFSSSVIDGFIRINRRWQNNDSITVDLPLIPRKIFAHPAVKADSARLALQYGPFVYCLESPDQTDGHVLSLFLPSGSSLTGAFRRDLFNGINIITAKGMKSLLFDGKISSESTEIRAIPYFLWANRGLAEMTVWIPIDSTHTEPLNRPPVSKEGKVSNSGGIRSHAVNDQITNTGPEQGFIWTDTGDTLWIQYDFMHEKEFSETGVFWNTTDQHQRLQPPMSWRVLAWVDGMWHPVYNYGKTWGTVQGIYNQVIFETVRTGALRLEARPMPGYQCGIIEWEVN